MQVSFLENDVLLLLFCFVFLNIDFKTHNSVPVHTTAARAGSLMEDK